MKLISSITALEVISLCKGGRGKNSKEFYLGLFTKSYCSFITKAVHALKFLRVNFITQH